MFKIISIFLNKWTRYAQCLGHLQAHGVGQGQGGHRWAAVHAVMLGVRGLGRASFSTSRLLTALSKQVWRALRDANMNVACCVYVQQDEYGCWWVQHNEYQFWRLLLPSPLDNSARPQQVQGPNKSPCPPPKTAVHEKCNPTSRKV